MWLKFTGEDASKLIVELIFLNQRVFGMLNYLKSVNEYVIGWEGCCTTVVVWCVTILKTAEKMVSCHVKQQASAVVRSWQTENCVSMIFFFKLSEKP